MEVPNRPAPREVHPAMQLLRFAVLLSSLAVVISLAWVMSEQTKVETDFSGVTLGLIAFCPVSAFPSCRLHP